MWKKQGMYVRIEAYGALLYLSTPQGIRNDIYVMFGKGVPQSESSATLVHAI